jgi:Bacterial SH3 domain/GDSL-like Lipase/Acylhydrolase family
MILRKLLLLLLVTLLASGVILAQGDVTGTTLTDLNMRDAPNSRGQVITQLPRGTSIVVEGRDSSSSWLLVHTPDGQARGWMAIQFLRLDEAISIPRLPDLTGTDLSQPFAPAAPGQPAAPPSIPPERTDYPALGINNSVIRSARAIYQRGQQRGNNPNMLIKIGESNTAGTVYMCTFHYSHYYLGPYPDLQPIVDRFNSTGSFCHYDYTARSGFAAANLLDPTWAIEPQCQAGETPLQCAYRIYKPSYALIYLGIADMGFYSEKQFSDSLTNIIRYLSSNGVIPILTTYPMSDTFNDGKPQSFNAVIRQVAAKQNVPLIDLRAAVAGYDNHGTGPDGYHLSVRDPDFTSFGGDELSYGRSMRELLTLQILKALAF